MQQIASITDICCGCAACAAICPNQCVVMTPDAAGFYKPKIDNSTCVDCGSCEHVCPMLTVEDFDDVDSAYWAKTKDANQLARSSSGGVFGLLAQACLAKGGVVYGASFSDSFYGVEHIRIESDAQLDRVMRSKYVQSKVDPNIYSMLKKDIDARRSVVFSGVPCQIKAVKNYLYAVKADVSCLLSVDVICHGVPSPKLWSAWVTTITSKHNANLSSVNFRDKQLGWKNYSVTYKFKRNEENVEQYLSNVFSQDWYMKSFLHNASLCGACFVCKSKMRCGSDITLGDYWGIEKAHPEASNNDGISAVVVKSGVGRLAFSEISDQLEYGESNEEKIRQENSPIENCVSPYSGYQEFMQEITTSCDIEKMQAKWSFSPSLRQRIKGKLSSLRK